MAVESSGPPMCRADASVAARADDAGRLESGSIHRAYRRHRPHPGAVLLAAAYLSGGTRFSYE